MIALAGVLLFNGVNCKRRWGGSARGVIAAKKTPRVYGVLLLYVRLFR